MGAAQWLLVLGLSMMPIVIVEIEKFLLARVGEGAYVAAGSTITQDLPSCALGIARARQVEKLNWRT